jgi:hypothetical protein
MAFSIIKSLWLRVASESDPNTMDAVAGLVSCLMCCFTRLKNRFRELMMVLIMQVDSMGFRSNGMILNLDDIDKLFAQAVV